MATTRHTLSLSYMYVSFFQSSYNRQLPHLCLGVLFENVKVFPRRKKSVLSCTRNTPLQLFQSFCSRVALRLELPCIICTSGTRYGFSPLWVEPFYFFASGLMKVVFKCWAYFLLQLGSIRGFIRFYSHLSHVLRHPSRQ